MGKELFKKSLINFLEPVQSLHFSVFSANFLKGVLNIDYGKLKHDEKFPLIAVAPQKKYISLYVVGDKDGVLLTTLYKSELGKVSVGKSCINIRNIRNINLVEIKNLVLDSIKQS